MAAKYGITDNCHYLIEEAGVDGNLFDQHEQSALFYSIESQAIDCSQYLLSIGLSANHKNKEGRTYVIILIMIQFTALKYFKQPCSYCCYSRFN